MTLAQDTLQSSAIRFDHPVLIIDDYFAGLLAVIMTLELRVRNLLDHRVTLELKLVQDQWFELVLEVAGNSLVGVILDVVQTNTNYVLIAVFI